MATRKRNLEQVEDEAQEPTLLHRIRNMWQFANLYQWIFLFGKAANIDDSLDIEVLIVMRLTAIILLADALPRI